jgi:hypothetical protein
MASYKVLIKPSAEKDLRSLPQSVIARVFKQIEVLQDEPFPRQPVKLGKLRFFSFGIAETYIESYESLRCVLSIAPASCLLPADLRPPSPRTTGH